jgi:hypothetical protein
MKKKQEDYGLELQEAYDRWEYIYTRGGSDPFHTDGVNLNLVRNHISYYREKIEETMPPENYPAAYFKELPPETDRNYMARSDEIRAAARASLAKYKADKNYKYLLLHRDDFTQKTRDTLRIDAVIGYVTSLEQYIEKDSLVDMRRHENGERYLNSFEECVLRMQKAPPENVQRSLFSLISDIPDEDNFDEDTNAEYDLDENTNEEYDLDEAKNEEYDEPKTEIDIVIQNKEKDGQYTENDRLQSTNIACQSVKTSPYSNIPDELKSLNQWVVYRTYPNKDGKLKKIIINPADSSFAHSDNPKTWVRFEQAKAYAESYRYKGLAFALKNGITFIDIDHAIKDGEIVSKEAKRLLELLPDTYTEKSVSGTGIHILLKGSLPPDAYRRNDRKGIEMYDSRRFICMTGDMMNIDREIKDYANTINNSQEFNDYSDKNGKREIKDCSDTLNDSHEIKDYSDIIAQIAYEFTGKRQPIKEYAAAPATQSDAALIEQISNSRSGAKFQALYGGDTSGYSSHSHAESALVFILAWWSRSPSQIDGIVRSSGLIRPKWDERRGNTTYGSQLINEALSVVSPRQEKKQEYYL